MTVEEVLLAIWARVLRGADVGTQDDFFRLGGDALSASEMLSLVRDALGVDIDLGSFRAAATVSDLSAAVEIRLQDGAEHGGTDAATAPVAFSQEGMLWHEQFAPGSFNLPPLVRRYQGHLDVAALERSLDEIVRRHAPLRTTFDVVDGRPLQRIGRHRPRALAVTDLSGLEPGRQRAVVGQVIADAAGRPFDLAEGPLFDPHLFRLADRGHVLVIRLHHLVFDDWAVGPFRRQLSILYSAYAAGRQPDLPVLRLEFADFCRRQRRLLAGPAGTRELAYWRQELAGAPFTVQLPIEDPERPPGSPHAAAGPLVQAVPPALVQPLRAMARRQRTTLYMAMLAVFAVVVHGYTGEDDLLFASVVANRNAAELEPLIGCFTKKILLRLRLAGDPTFAELMGRVRGAVLGALAHQDLAFETVVQDVLGGAAATHGLVPDVSVMFQAETPRQAQLVLPGLSVSGYDTGTPTQPHFASWAEDADARGRPVWGGGLYRGTFLILSVLEDEDGVSLVARGVFHPPAVRQLLARFEEVLAQVVAGAEATVATLARAGLRRDDSAPATGGHPPTGAGGRSVAGSVVRLRGFSLEPGRIEAIIRRCPGVADAAVVVRDADHGDPRIVAYIAAASGEVATPGLAELRARLWAELPGYAWPAALVVVAALPRNGDGRVDADALPAPDDGPDPESRIPAATPDERLLATLWSEVLGGGPVGADANYWQRFSFIEVLRRARRCDGAVEATAEQVRRNRTVQTLAADIASNRVVG